MNFEELELHPKITKKLQKAGFTTLTTIQQKTLPITLTGKSIIASSKTGSGKTLCFLLPILQKLRTLKWNINDGLGALILTPTRELALQINDVLLKINNKHKTSVVIGGVSKEQELDAEIIIATPGRFLDHMQSVDLGNYNLQLLVLDEADKMLEMGFKEDIEEILDYFNTNRQTLLFSATPNSLVAKIGNLVDNDAEIVCDDEVATIKQIFYKVEMKDKPALLYEFMKKQKQKALVFFSTCKEVKFYHKLFRKLGFFVNYFAGAMGQNKRIDQLNDFIENGRFLFCTDVGARGLDFNVDTVLQLDCAESVETYVHRMGRTGRNNKEGTNIVYLVGDEERIIDDFKKGKWKRMAKDSELNNLDDCLISIKERKDANERYKKEIREKIIESGEIQILAEKYIISYLRFLEMGKRRYFGESVSKVESLMENLGVTVNLQENKKDKDENRKKEKKNTDE